jgi:cytoskeletal protein RodZ
MPTVAEQLRAARETKKLTIQQVAGTTKIRTDHIRALEDGNFNAFSAPIYIRGSVKNYATLLKLDVSKIMTDLDTELKATEKFKDPPPLVETRQTALDRFMLLLSKIDLQKGLIGFGVIAIVLIAVIIFFAWRHHRRASPVINLPPAVYQPTNTGETLPLPKH